MSKKAKEIDTNNSWSVIKIGDKESFFKKILTLIPNNSIWSIEGIANNDLRDYLLKFQFKDDQIVRKGTIWPRQKTLKVIINEDSRDDLINKLTLRNLDWDIIHQHIYNGDKFYLSSYDCLDEACTWISKDFKHSDFKDLIEADQLELYDFKNEKKEITIENNYTKTKRITKIIGWLIIIFLSFNIFKSFRDLIFQKQNATPFIPDYINNYIIWEKIIYTILLLLLGFLTFKAIRKKRWFIYPLILVLYFVLPYILSFLGDMILDGLISN
jgi:hypothetical protein